MPLTVHVVNTRLVNVDNTGMIIDKNSEDTTINQMKNTRMESRIIPDSSIPSSTGYPTIKEYLTLEADAGFILNHIDQTYIITATQTISGMYTLPVATSTILGGVKQGDNVAIDDDGIISVSVTVTVAAPQITTNQNNYAPGSCDVLVLTADAARNITGFAPATVGSSGFLTIINTGSFVITLKYQSTSSLATARMNTTYLADYNLEAGGGSALLWYDATSQFWRIL